MPKKTTIPVNHFVTEDNKGISIERISMEEINTFKEDNTAHRHDCHSFMMLEKGSVSIEIDFRKHRIKSPALIYMHPNQVHLVTSFRDVRVVSLAITNENLRPEYAALLEDITPAKPLSLNKEIFALLFEAVSFCIKCAERKQGKLYNQLLKDSCNAFVALVISEYAEGIKPPEKLSRAETVTKSFNQLLERYYTSKKRPAEYATALNISAAYLNECVKQTTGRSVSYHIQQRVILEAKRLLYHSDKSAGEIAFSLGYEDHRYFSRLFSKITAVSPLAFRNKNRG